MNRKDAENAEEKGRERFVPENSLVSMPGVQTQSGPRPRDLENSLVSMPGVQTQSGPRLRELENSLVSMPGVQTQSGPRPRDRESSLLSLPGVQTQSGPRLRPTILAALFLGALCISALSLPSEAQKRPAKAKAKPTPKRGKSISGSGFTLQERSGSLDQEALEYLGNPKTEAAVKKALKYLADNQNPDGSWGDARYSSDVGIVGLCSLSFMAAGHQPDRGPYGTILRRATDYLAKHSQRTGLINNPNAMAGPPMYGHGFATLALAELYGMTRRADLRDKLESAVSLILRTQNSEGGWRYQPRPADADLSVVVCQVMALRAAANAGIKVPKETTDRAVEYVKRCANNPDGGFSYMPSNRGSNQARTGAGVLCLIVMGERGADECKRGLEYLLTKPPGARDGHMFYAFYYCTQATYQAGGKYWSYWYPKVSDYLLNSQRPDGSWYDGPGQAYGTAMGTLALQVPATLLPIYQK